MGRGSIKRPEHLAEKLAALRHSLGLSQNQLIDRLDLADQVAQSEISGFERGVRVPSVLVLLRYARLFGIHIDDLVDDDIELDSERTEDVK